MSGESSNDSAKLFKQLADAASLRGDVPALTAATLREWGGLEGFVRAGRELYEDPDLTAHNRVMIWKSVQELIKDCHRIEPPSDEMGDIDTEEIEAALHGFLATQRLKESPGGS